MSWPSTTRCCVVRRGAASAVRPRAAGGSGALSDGVRPAPVSVAAPTAGLHLTADVLARCQAAGARRADDRTRRRPRHVPPDHLRPGGGPRDARRAVPRSAEKRCGLRATPDRVVAVGTTVVRALESAAATGRTEGSTDLFIRRGHRFAIVDTLLTNFHVPRSSLLVLVDAFVGPRGATCTRMRWSTGTGSCPSATRCCFSEPTGGVGRSGEAHARLRGRRPGRTGRARAHRTRRIRHAVLHAGRHAGRGEDAASVDLEAHRRHGHPRQHVPPDAAAGRGRGRATGRLARVHRMDRARPHRLRRLPGLLAQPEGRR